MVAYYRSPVEAHRRGWNSPSDSTAHIPTHRSGRKSPSGILRPTRCHSRRAGRTCDPGQGNTFNPWDGDHGPRANGTIGAMMRIYPARLFTISTPMFGQVGGFYLWWYGLSYTLGLSRHVPLDPVA